MSLMLLSSPLEQFEVLPVVMMSVLGTPLVTLTNHGLYTAAVVALLVSAHVVTTNGHRLVPSQWSVALESAYVSLLSMVQGQIGSRYEVYTPFVYVLFMWVLVSNLTGNVPYSYTTTTSVITALGLSVIVWVGVTLLALHRHGIRFFAFFVPSGTPLALVPMLVLIEVVSYVARAVSLGTRLWANVVAGHTLLNILASFLGKLFMSGTVVALLTLVPFAVFVALVGLEIAVSLIQSYVLSILVCSYLKDALDLH
jgi:F-type H+-transporting ATPase subunit a